MFFFQIPVVLLASFWRSLIQEAAQYECDASSRPFSSQHTTVISRNHPGFLQLSRNFRIEQLLNGLRGLRLSGERDRGLGRRGCAARPRTSGVDGANCFHGTIGV